MVQVSEGTQDLFIKLVSWEMFGDTSVDPKVILRQTPLEDLSRVASNIEERGSGEEKHVCELMVEAEMMYRTGRLIGDWHFTREGEKVRLSYNPTKFHPMQRDLHLSTIGME